MSDTESTYKDHLGKTVYEAAKDRVRDCFKRFPNTVISFSGGKDSTAVLNISIEVARELDILPVKVLFFDEEGVAPDTVEYVKRVRERPEVNLEWYCLPFKHKLGTSFETQSYTCWEPGLEDKWVREMPEFAITEHPTFRRGMTFQEFGNSMYADKPELSCVLTGVRTQESTNRLRAIISSENPDEAHLKKQVWNTYRGMPVYDWTAEDVWIYVHKFDLDYNRFYDKLNMLKGYHENLGLQRVSHPYGVHPMKDLGNWHVMYPDLVDKVLDRVPGGRAAARYSKTHLYAQDGVKKPDHMSWKQYAKIAIDYIRDVRIKNEIKKSINGILKRHAKKTNDAIPDAGGHALTGVSWEIITSFIIRADTESRANMRFHGNSRWLKDAKLREKYNDNFEKFKLDYGKN